MWFGDYDKFEEDLLESVKGGIYNYEVCHGIYSGLTNTLWYHVDDPDNEVAYSFRSAAGLIADLRDEGEDYIDWYCCAPEGKVSEVMEREMEKYGWKWKKYPKSDDSVTLEEMVKRIKDERMRF